MVNVAIILFFRIICGCWKLWIIFLNLNNCLILRGTFADLLSIWWLSSIFSYFILIFINFLNFWRLWSLYIGLFMNRHIFIFLLNFFPEISFGINRCWHADWRLNRLLLIDSCDYRWLYELLFIFLFCFWRHSYFFILVTFKP